MEFIQHNLLWVALAVASGGLVLFNLWQGAGSGLSVADATLLINREDALLLDVRETAEFSAGHAPHARHIALGQLNERISEIEKFKEKPLIVCCASGNRSSTACARLKKQGFARVYNLNGGMNAWREAGLPVSK